MIEVFILKIFKIKNLLAFGNAALLTNRFSQFNQQMKTAPAAFQKRFQYKDTNIFAI